MDQDCGCDEKSKIFNPHTSRHPKEVLPTTHQLCASLFHSRPVWEWDSPEICLHVPPCPKVTVKVAQTLIGVVYDADGQVVYLKRFSNCRPKQGHVMHTEQVLLKDKSFLSALKDGCLVEIYSKYQPCHHSSGNCNFKDPRSCTSLLHEFMRSVLQPRNIHMHYYVCNLFRATWNMDDEYYGKTIRSARKGIYILTRATPNFELRGMDAHHWQLLGVMCAEALPFGWYHAREAYDAQIRLLLADLQYPIGRRTGV